MKVADFEPGDIVAIDDGFGGERLVKITGLLGPERKGRGKKGKDVNIVLMHDVDRDTYREQPEVHMGDPNAEAELVDALATRLLRVKEWRRAALADFDGAGVDPLASGERERGGAW